MSQKLGVVVRGLPEGSPSSLQHGDKVSLVVGMDPVGYVLKVHQSGLWRILGDVPVEDGRTLSGDGLLGQRRSRGHTAGSHSLDLESLLIRGPPHGTNLEEKKRIL